MKRFVSSSPACFLPYIFPWLYFSCFVVDPVTVFWLLGASGVCTSISNSAVLTVNTAKVCVENVLVAE